MQPDFSAQDYSLGIGEICQLIPFEPSNTPVKDVLHSLKELAEEQHQLQPNSPFWHACLEQAIRTRRPKLIESIGVEKLVTKYSQYTGAIDIPGHQDPLLLAVQKKNVMTLRAVLTLPFIDAEHNNASAVVSAIFDGSGSSDVRQELYRSGKVKRSILPALVGQLTAPLFKKEFLLDWLTLPVPEQEKSLDCLVRALEKCLTTDGAIHTFSAIFQAKWLKSFSCVLYQRLFLTGDSKMIDALLVSYNAFKAEAHSNDYAASWLVSQEAIFIKCALKSLASVELTHEASEILLGRAGKVIGENLGIEDHARSALKNCLVSLQNPDAQASKLLKLCIANNNAAAIEIMLSLDTVSTRALLDAVMFRRLEISDENMLMILKHPGVLPSGHIERLLQRTVEAGLILSFEYILRAPQMRGKKFQKRSPDITNSEIRKRNGYIIIEDIVACAIFHSRNEILKKILVSQKSVISPSDLQYYALAMDSSNPAAAMLLYHDARIDPFQREGFFLKSFFKKYPEHGVSISSEFNLKASIFQKSNYWISSFYFSRMDARAFNRLSLALLHVNSGMSESRRATLYEVLSSLPSSDVAKWISENKLDSCSERAINAVASYTGESATLNTAAIRLQVASSLLARNKRPVIRGDTPSETAQDAFLVHQGMDVYKKAQENLKGTFTEKDMLEKIRAAVIDQLLAHYQDLSKEDPVFEIKHLELQADKAALIEAGANSPKLQALAINDVSDVYEQAFRAVFIASIARFEWGHYYYENSLLTQTTRAYQMMLYAFATISQTSDPESYQSQVFSFICHLGSVVRSRSEGETSQDSHACGLGSFTWIAQSLRIHPEYASLYVSERDGQIESAFNAYVNGKFRTILQEMKTAGSPETEARFRLDAITGLSVNNDSNVPVENHTTLSGDEYTNKHAKIREDFIHHSLGGYTTVQAEVRMRCVLPAGALFTWKEADHYRMLFSMLNLGNDQLAAELASTFRVIYPALESRVEAVRSAQYADPFLLRGDQEKSLPASIVAKRGKQSLLYRTYLRQQAESESVVPEDLKDVVETVVGEHPDDDIESLMLRMPILC